MAERSPVTGQHQSVHPAGQAAPHDIPVGSIALLPTEPQAVEFERAAIDGGGVIAPLSRDTRALLWVAADGADQLDAVLAQHPGIGWVQLPWAGVDAFRDVIASHPEVFWTSAKGAYAQPVAEHALMFMLALLRIVPARLSNRTWIARKGGRSLFGLTVCIVGAGGIARALAELLEPFGVRLRIVRRRAEPFPGAELVTTDVLEGVRGADVVVLAAAHTSGTERFIDERVLSALRSDAILINVARGALIDTEALVAALQAGELGGAGIDVTDPEPLPDGHPLWNCPNTIVTPHTADTPEMTAPLLAERIRHNVAAYVHAGEYIGVVNPNLGY